MRTKRKGADRAEEPAGRDAGFAEAFVALRRMLVRHASSLRVTKDGPEHYELYSTREVHGRPLYFAGLALRRRDVTLYLYPVCTHPGLLAGMSEALKARMQGRSCFRFVALDEELLAEIAELTSRGLDRYRAEGWV